MGQKAQTLTTNVIQSYARTTLVAIVSRLVNFNTELAISNTSYSEDMHSIPVLWGVWGASQFNCVREI